MKKRFFYIYCLIVSLIFLLGIFWVWRGTVRDAITITKLENYKTEKLKGADGEEFKLKNAFNLPDKKISDFFKKEFLALESLLIPPSPSFKQMMDGIKKYSFKF